MENFQGISPEFVTHRSVSRIGYKKFSGIGYKKFSGIGYKKFPSPMNCKSENFSKENFSPEILKDIFEFGRHFPNTWSREFLNTNSEKFGNIGERFLGIFAEFSQNC